MPFVILGEIILHKQKPLFTLIIPAYNSSDTIRECFESVINQTCKDFEVFIVDDGSHDDTLRICQDILTERPEMAGKAFICPLEHRGPSHARFHGCQRANGEYIVHIDSDDTISPNFLAEISKVISSHPDMDFDLIRFGARRDAVGEGAKHEHRFHCDYSENMYTAHDFLDASITKGSATSFSCICLYAYRTEMYRNDRFPDGCHEDIAHMPHMILKAKNIFCMNGIDIYNYSYVATSFSHHPAEDKTIMRFLHFQEAMRTAICSIKDSDLPEEKKAKFIKFYEDLRDIRQENKVLKWVGNANQRAGYDKFFYKGTGI